MGQPPSKIEQCFGMQKDFLEPHVAITRLKQYKPAISMLFFIHRVQAL
jgi:hypothetical protein